MNTSLEQLARGTTEIISLEGLERKFARAAQEKRSLRIKAGFDPTAPDMHLGHVVLLKKLRQFQDLGHEVFFLVGDFTAQVGDPSGRDQLRPKMDPEEIQANARTYERQVFKVLDPGKTRVVFNSHWLGGLTAQQMLEISSHCTVAQMLARADFKKRYEEQKEISLLEFIYPLLQGYDSVHLKADVELGGNDQKFNLLMGRQMQEAFGQEPQVVLMTPLLEGTDGVKKMSKSLDNYIGINEPPDEMFGKVMSISDELMARYFEVLTDVDLDQVRGMHPKDAKMLLGETLVSRFHSGAAAGQAREKFERVFSRQAVPDDAPLFSLKDAGSPDIITVLTASGLVESKREARRLVQQGSVVYNGERISDENFRILSGVLKVGKRRFLRVTDAPD